MRPRSPSMKWTKPPVFVLALLPLLILIAQAFSGQFPTGPVLARLCLDQDLGANPVEFVQHATGSCTLISLCMTLPITPLRNLRNQRWLIKFACTVASSALSYG